NGGALFNAEFGIRHRGSTVPERSGVALSFCRRLVFQTEMLSKQAEGLARYVRRTHSDEDEVVRVLCYNIDIQINRIISICGEVNQHGIRVYGDAIDRDVD
ncbi:hypothetical protein ACLBVG_32510, partial [Pseudomonas aeruginosa]|uniref:hypothetical protein n=1 Tax=Pseudomonas aeruginosa TaxID=287 RepID=UPI00396A79C1